jgi:hypothetical protein
MDNRTAPNTQSTVAEIHDFPDGIRRCPVEPHAGSPTAISLRVNLRMRSYSPETTVRVTLSEL